MLKLLGDLLPTQEDTPPPVVVQEDTPSPVVIQDAKLDTTTPPPEDASKVLKKNQKLLRQILDLEGRVTSGEVLDDAAIIKVSRRTEIEDEISRLLNEVELEVQ